MEAGQTVRAFNAKGRTGAHAWTRGAICLPIAQRIPRDLHTDEPPDSSGKVGDEGMGKVREGEEGGRSGTYRGIVGKKTSHTPPRSFHVVARSTIIMTEKKRVLIPGGAGYIGSHVALTVLNTRKFRVTSM